MSSNLIYMILIHIHIYTYTHTCIHLTELLKSSMHSVLQGMCCRRWRLWRISVTRTRTWTWHSPNRDSQTGGKSQARSSADEVFRHFFWSAGTVWHSPAGVEVDGQQSLWLSWIHQFTLLCQAPRCAGDGQGSRDFDEDSRSGAGYESWCYIRWHRFADDCHRHFGNWWSLSAWKPHQIRGFSFAADIISVSLWDFCLIL